LRLRPLEPLEGRVAVFTAGSIETAGLDADVVQVSPHLGDRAALEADLARADADTYLVELKGAAGEPRARARAARGRRGGAGGARAAGRAGRERRRLAGAGRRRARPRSRRGGDRLMERRYGDPLPLGEPGGLPYSKGLMARALIAGGVSAERAYRLAQRIELD